MKLPYVIVIFMCGYSLAGDNFAKERQQRQDSLAQAARNLLAEVQRLKPIVRDDREYSNMVDEDESFFKLWLTTTHTKKPIKRCS